MRRRSYNLRWLRSPRWKPPRTHPHPRTSSRCRTACIARTFDNPRRTPPHNAGSRPPVVPTHIDRSACTTAMPCSVGPPTPHMPHRRPHTAPTMRTTAAPYRTPCSHPPATRRPQRTVLPMTCTGRARHTRWTSRSPRSWSQRIDHRRTRKLPERCTPPTSDSSRSSRAGRSPAPKCIGQPSRRASTFDNRRSTPRCTYPLAAGNDPLLRKVSCNRRPTQPGTPRSPPSIEQSHDSLSTLRRTGHPLCIQARATSGQRIGLRCRTPDARGNAVPPTSLRARRR